MKKKLMRICLGVGSIYLLVCVAMFFLQRKLLYMPPAYSSDDERIARRLGAQRIELEAADGQQLFAWWMGEPRETAPFPMMDRIVSELLPELEPVARSESSFVWLNLGGNAASVGGCASLASTLLARGQRFLRVAYRGYSGNDGSPSESGLRADALAAWDWLRAQGIPAQEIIVVGKSLGGGVAVALTEVLQERGELPAALVLETTFTSVAERGQQLYPFLPVRWLVLDSFDNEARLPRLAGKLPIAIIGATEDEVVPYPMSEKLRALVPGCWFLSCPTDHNHVILASGKVVDNLLTWLATTP